MIKEIKNQIENEEQIRYILREEIENAINKKNLDLQENQQYPFSQSFMISDLSEKEWYEMKKDGARELKPYYNKARGNWSIALSLGYCNNGKRLRKVISAKTEDEVKKKYDEFRKNNIILEAEKENEIHDESQMLFKEYMKKYIKITSEGIISDKSLEQKEINGRRSIGIIGGYKMCELNSQILADCMNSIASTQYVRGGEINYYSQEVINKAYTVLNGCITSGFNDDIFKKNPMDKVKKPKTKQVKTEKKNKPLPDKKVVEIMNVLQDDLKWSIFFELLIITGCRPSEILGLNFSDISYSEYTVKITKALTASIYKEIVDGKEKKSRTPIIGPIKNERGGQNPYAKRTFRLPEELVEKIKKYELKIKNDEKVMKMRKENKTEDVIFIGSRYQKRVQYQTHRKAFLGYLERHNVDREMYTIYSTRHTFCVNNIKSGADMKSLQILMGDKTLNMIMEHYADLEKEYVLKQNENHNEYIQKILKNSKKSEKDIQ